MANEIKYEDFARATSVKNTFGRQNPIPLDKSSWFSSFEDAQKYAKGDGSDERAIGLVSYAGQIIAVKTDKDSNENDIYKSYIIQGDSTLNEVGGITFKVSADDKLQFSQDGGKTWTDITLPSSAAGKQGITGAQGVTGLQGVTGVKGATGATGATGAKGADGVQGRTGAQGVTGAKGADGTNGKDGERGATGPQGVTGLQGPKGEQGNPGEKGIQGATGLQGVTGARGADGKDGSNGIQGATGPQGVTGLQGPKGNTGDTGATGATGATGPRGAAGATGMRGNRTFYGEDTKFANTTADTIQVVLSAGQFVTGDFYCYTKNADWTVWSCDDIDDAHYTFTNRGSVKGADGKDGTNGAQGVTGAQGATGLRGATGPKGEKGEKGADGTGVAIKASNADCKEVGDGYIDTNGHLQMLTTLPDTFTDCGEIKGPKGDQGATGIQGMTGPAGKDGTDADATYTPADETLKTMQLGGIPSNTTAASLKGKTVSDLFDMLLFPTYVPEFVDATLTAKLTSTALVEIGGTLPKPSATTSVAYTQTSAAGANKALGGTATVTMTAGSNNSSSTTGRKTWSYKADFAQGTELIKDSKGNNTNQTAASGYNTLLGGGTTSYAANIGGTGPAKYVIAARTNKTSSASCEVVYPYYAPNANGAETKQTLTSNAYFLIEKYSANNASTQVFCVVPSSFTNVSITQANVSGQYLDENKCTIANGKLKAISSAEKTFGSVKVNYTKYAFTTTDLAGEANYRVAFTKG